MDVTLEAIIINTYNPNHDIRVQAENALQELLNTPGSLSALITSIAKIESGRDLRQAVGLVLKNRIRDYWDDESKKRLPTSVDEREYFKQGLLQVILVEQERSIRDMLAEVIRVVSSYDYPER